MFDVGLGEMAVIALVAVLVFGPERLPEFARQAGRMLRTLRSFATSARDELRSELGPEFSDLELRLSRMTRWVLDAEQRALPYAFRLGAVHYDAGNGAAHQAACLRALALYGSREAA